MRAPLAALSLALAAGCLPRERLNETCDWVHDAPLALDMSQPAHRKHLEVDVRLAEDLGIRFGDAVGPPAAVEANLGPRRECTRTLLAGVAELHGVTEADIGRATGARDEWIDLLTVYLPVLVLFSVLARLLTRRVETAFEPDERWLEACALLLLALVVSGFAVLLVEMWSWVVESLRLRNAHISYRAFRLPVVEHRLEVWLAGVLVFGGIAGTLARRRHA